jgi:hypothetical protein
MNPHEELVKRFFEIGQQRNMDSFALEKAIIAILAVMAAYRANRGREVDYLQGIVRAADKTRRDAA